MGDLNEIKVLWQVIYFYIFLGPPEQNMEELRSALGKGEFTNAKRDSIILNCAVGLYVYGKVDSIADGVTFARSTLYEGKGIEKLLEFIKVSSSLKN